METNGNGNGSVGGLLKSVPVKVLVGALCSALLIVSASYASSYINRLEEVEKKASVIEKVANDVEWIKKFLESNRR